MKELPSEQPDDHSEDIHLTPGQKISIEFLSQFSDLLMEGKQEEAHLLEDQVSTVLPGIYDPYMFRAEERMIATGRVRQYVPYENLNNDDRLIVDACSKYFELVAFGNVEEAQLYKDNMIKEYPELARELNLEFNDVDFMYPSVPFFSELDPEFFQELRNKLIQSGESNQETKSEDLSRDDPEDAF